MQLARSPPTTLAGFSARVVDRWLHDNDVVIKVCGYQLLDLLLTCMGKTRPAILATSTFSLPSQIRKKAKIRNQSAATEELRRFLENAEVIEPERAELELAAAIEEEAVRRALPLDGGESQLIAILAYRTMPLLVTGDKRAIIALYELGRPDVHGRMACLEQLTMTLARHAGFQSVRSHVCPEPQLDRALSSCFACSSEHAADESIEQGLTSYVDHLRRSSGSLLTPGDDLLAIVA